MAYKCEKCGKSTVTGISQSHHRGVAGKRWKKRAQKTIRTFKPNIKWASVLVAGKVVRMKLCTRCIKRYKKDNLLARQRVSSTVASL
jgi:large subunit ribosomal protein L28